MWTVEAAPSIHPLWITGFFRLLTRNHWHVAAEWGWPAKMLKRSLFSLGLETAINQKRPTTISTLLTLHSHPTVDTGSGPNDAEHFLLSCQVHLPPTAAGIWLLIKKRKKVRWKFKKEKKNGKEHCADAPVSYCITPLAHLHYVHPAWNSRREGQLIPWFYDS